MEQCEFMLETAVSAAISKLDPYKMKHSWPVLNQARYLKVSILGSIIVRENNTGSTVFDILSHVAYARLSHKRLEQFLEKLKMTSEG